MAQPAWFAGASAIAFLIPYVFSSLLDLQHDAYYAVYFASAAAVLFAYVRLTSFDVRRFFTQNWQLGLGVGALSTAFVVFNVLARNDSTPHPSGLYFVFEIGWRGLIYGIVDALLLTALPGMIAFAAMRGSVNGITRRAGFAVLSLLLVATITAAYHLGYEQYREDGVGQPEIGNTVISLPMLVSVNPAGSVIAHASMHVAAVTHAYETDTFLPPQTSAD